MRDLSSLRRNPASDDLEDARLQRGRSVQAGVRQWLALQRVFAGQLEQTADLFGPERRSAMAELQTRLRRLID